MAESFSFGASAYPQQTPVAKKKKKAPMAMAQLPQPQPTPAIDWAAIQNIVRPPDVQGDANRATGMPSYMPGSASPFNTGFFNAKPQPAFDPLAAQATQRQISGKPGTLPVMPPTGRVVADPFDASGAPLPGVDWSRLAPPSSAAMPPANPRMNAIPGGVEGMINPALPDATRYQDPNFFQVRPGQSSLPPGVTVGDGTTPAEQVGGAPGQMQASLQLLRMLGII